MHFHNLQSKNDKCIFAIITPYIRIMDFDWLIAGVFFVYISLSWSLRKIPRQREKS